ncbi:MAG: sugar ABC transporter permease [Clostridia bacterium]|nr:sugar ABC transporter permease [Clostridia bacterium]
MSSLKKKSGFLRQLPYWLLALPAIIYLLMFNYAPMFGAIIAFKDYKVRDGIFGSEWVGLRNFKYFFSSVDAPRILRNTVLYNLAFIFITKILVAAIFALMMYEINSKLAAKVYQTSMLIPHFMSYVVISAVLMIFLNPTSGMFNVIRQQFGLEGIMWYSEPKYWPFIIVFVNTWKDAGFASLYLYSSLLAIDSSLFEAADLDGAGKLRKIWHISVPALIPMICIIIINSLGSIMSSGIDLFLTVPLESTALIPTTDVIATYTYRGLKSSNYSYTSAVGLFQGVVGLILVLTSNGIIRKVNPENAMF